MGRTENRSELRGDVKENVKAMAMTKNQLINKNISSVDESLFKKAVLIRTVENKLLQLFSEGKLNGTVHTCVGQEFSALAFAGQLTKDDTVFSNHRCHGHYLSFT